MKAKIYKSALFGDIETASSKSFAHRILICAAFSDKPTIIRGNLSALDLRATADCLKELGAGIVSLGNNETQVFPIKSFRSCRLNCGESGSTLRFILPVVCALGIRAEITGGAGLAVRPLSELIECLSKAGADFSGSRLPLKTGGRLKPGDYYITGSVSSQYITGLMLALTLLNGDSRIIIEGEQVSSAYIDITLDVMKKFGANTEKTESGYLIRGGRKFVSPGIIEVEGDWSAAAFLLAGGAVSGDVRVTNVSLSSMQGDKALVKILRDMGCEIEDKGQGLAAHKSRLSAVTADAGEFPDIVPILAVVMACAEGKSVITGVRRLRLKESNRAAAVTDMLKRLGVDVTEYEDNITIVGRKSFSRAELISYNDHRLVMSGAIAGLNGELTTITDIEAAAKSYPDFFGDFMKLGGRADVF